MEAPNQEGIDWSDDEDDEYLPPEEGDNELEDDNSAVDPDDISMSFNMPSPAVEMHSSVKSNEDEEEAKNAKNEVLVTDQDYRDFLLSLQQDVCSFYISSI